MERKRIPAKDNTGKGYFQEKFGKKPAKSKKKFESANDANEEWQEKRPGRKRIERMVENKPDFKKRKTDDRKGYSEKRFGERDFENKRGKPSKNGNDERRSSSDKKYGERDFGDKSGFKSKRTFEKGTGGRRSFSDKESGERDFENKSGFKSNRTFEKGADERRSFTNKQYGERDFADKPGFKSKRPFERKPFPGKDSTKPKDKRQGIKKFFDEEQEHEKVYSGRGFANKKGKSFNPKADMQATEQRVTTDSMPLNKYIAHCGICSRRDAVALIKDGKVKVNDAIITEPGFKLMANEKVELNGKKISIQKNLIYVLLNKPKGYITTTDDPKGRRTVMDIFAGQFEERIFPIGRLDRNTTGLLLLTNDGELAQKLSHPKYKMRKIYQVTLDKNLSQEDFDKIKKGLTLEDGTVEVDALEYLDEKSKLGIEIHSGKNRIVRRIFESLGYTVEKLDRVMYAGLTKKNVLRGKWRFLSSQEVINLKHIQ